MNHETVVQDTAPEEVRRDTGVIVLIYLNRDDSLCYSEFGTKKSVSDFISKIGGPDRVLKLYVGAKERAIETNVTYTF